MKLEKYVKIESQINDFKSAQIFIKNETPSIRPHNGMVSHPPLETYSAIADGTCGIAHFLWTGRGNDCQIPTWSCSVDGARTWCGQFYPIWLWGNHFYD